MANTTIEDVLKKHLKITGHPGSQLGPMWPEIKEAMQEWASLQTPSNEKYGWVKASERLPEYKKTVYIKFGGMKYCGYVNNMPISKTPYFIAYGGYQMLQEDFDKLEWLDESTPIPILTPYGWTRVEDGLPDVYGSLLATDGETVKEVFFGKVTNKTEAKFVFTAGLKTITHWMPLPTKPNL